MNELVKSNILISPDSSAVLIVDCQSCPELEVCSAGNDAPWTRVKIVLQHAEAFSIPVISTIYAGERVSTAEPLPPIAHLDNVPRTHLNPWEEDTVRARISAARRDKIVVLGNCAEAGVSFAALGALEIGYQPYVVVDAIQSVSASDASTALSRMTQAGVVPVSSRQLLLEWSR
ncbi:MAG: isochorismatase family protein [Gammaproteobacteria bacterium]